MSANCLYKFSAIDHVASAADSLCLRSLISAVELVSLDSILKIVSWLAVIVSVKFNTWNQEYQNELARYNAELQSFQAEVGEQTAKVSTNQQKAVYYEQQADKYYKWSQTEIQQYVQNNSKTINKAMVAQATQQQRR